MAWLGYAGLMPFYASALWCWTPLQGRALAAQGFVIYGVVILAFLGGTLWGYAVVLPEREKHFRLVLSNLTALFAATAGLIGAPILASLLLALGQVTLLWYERSGRTEIGWYLRLRTRLVLAVLPAHLILATALLLAPLDS